MKRWVVKDLVASEFGPWKPNPKDPMKPLVPHLTPRGRKVLRRAFRLALDAKPIEIHAAYNDKAQLILNVSSPPSAKEES